jgi:hypothetical protein
MPSHVHEALLQLFRNRPLLAPKLLQTALSIGVPRHTDARIHSADLTEVQPAEYRADLVTVLLRDGPVLGIVVEVQLSRDERKRYVWPAYAVNLRAQLECPVQVLVVTDSDAVARWAAKPVDIGGGNIFAPIVIGPAGVPEIVDEVEVDPELAVLSAMTHGQDADFIKAARIAAAAQRASNGLDTERAGMYFSFIHNSLSEAAREALRDMTSANPEFQIDFSQFVYERGEIAGRDKGEHQALVSVVTKQLSQRFGPLDDVTRSRIASAHSDDLEDVAERLLTASTLDDALGQI